MATSGVNLANSSDVVANSCSVIQGDRIVNILDLLPGGNQGPSIIDTYSKLQSDVLTNRTHTQRQKSIAKSGTYNSHQEPRGPRGRREPKETWVSQEEQETKEPKETQDQQEHRAIKETRD